MDVCNVSKHTTTNNNKNNNNVVSKNAMKLLLSVSAFSIMVFLALPCYSSLLFPFLINSLFDVYVSAFTKQSFSSTLEKNCVFLLCNGLLMIIFTNSGLIGKSPQPDTSGGGIIVRSSPLAALQQVGLENDVEDDHDVENGSLQIVTLEREEKDEDDDDDDDDDDDVKNVSLQIVALEREEEEEEEVEEQELQDEEDEMENGIIKYEDYFDEEEEATTGLLSKEEFNKICEDFIRRVKEDIKFGRR